MRKFTLFLSLLTVTACSGATGPQEETSSEDALGTKVDEGCNHFAISPDRDHVVYGSCNTVAPSTVFMNIQTGAKRTSPSTPKTLASFLPFEDGVIFPTDAGYEIFDWAGTQHAVARTPTPNRQSFATIPINHGAGLILWHVENEDKGWQLRTYVATAGGSTVAALSLPAPTAEPLKEVLAAPDGSHLLVRVGSGDAYRVSTSGSTAPTLVAQNVGWPVGSSYDGHSLLVSDRRDVNVGAFSSGKLVYFNVDTNTATPLSDRAVQVKRSSSGVRPEAEQRDFYFSTDHPDHLLERGGKVYFAENDYGNDRYVVKVWNRTTPATAPSVLASAPGTFTAGKGLTPFYFSTDGAYLIYDATFPGRPRFVERQVHAVRLDGSKPDAVVGKSDDWTKIAIGPAATIALSGFESPTLTLVDLATGSAKAVSTNANYATNNVLISRDGTTLFNDAVAESGETHKLQSATVYAGSPGPGMRAVYNPTGLFPGYNLYTRDRATMGPHGLFVAERTDVSRWRFVRVNP